MVGLVAKYQRYAEYKDSGVEWLGEIPSEWELWKLSHAYSEIGSGTTPPTDNEKWFDGEIPWVTTGELRESTILGTKKKISKKTIDQFPTLRKYPVGSIAIAMYGATIGRLGIFGVEATTNQACCVMTLSKVIDNKYLFYWLQAFKNEIVQLSSGGGQPNINQEKVSALKVSAPKLNQQIQIANFLDHETAKIDSLIEKQQQLIQLLKEKRQAVISHAVTKGLDPRVKMKDSGVEWLGEVPEHWEISRLKHILDMPMRNGLFKKKDQFGSGSLLVNVTDLFVENNFINIDSLESVQTTFDERKAYKVNYGDLFFVRSSLKLEGIGRSASFLSYHDNVVFECHVVNARPNVKKTSPKYLTRYLNSIAVIQEYIRRSKTTTMTTIDQNGISSINIVVPPKVEQINIDNYLDNQLEIFSHCEKKAKAIIDLLIERRTALISAAVTGKIDVRNWQNPTEAKMECSA